MPTGIYKRTSQTRLHMSLAKKGKTPYVMTDKIKYKMSKSKVGISTYWIAGDKNHLWKGDKVKYRALHSWISRRLGMPRFCEECGNKELRHRQYHWANISKKYKRNVEDWRRLCVKCHSNYDKK